MRTAFFVIATAFSISTTAQDAWKNPEIDCTRKMGDAIQQFPYDHNKPEREGGDVKGMNKFDKRMRELFSESGMTEREAMDIYRMLLRSQLIRDESFGMPSPDAPPRRKLTIEDYKKRIAIRKTEEGNFEILWFDYGCGTNFMYSRISFSNGKVMKKDPIERWSDSYPC